MSDRFHTEIEIGGPVTSAQLKTIASLTAQVGMSCAWEDIIDDVWIEQHLLRQMEENDQYFTVNAHELSPDFEQDLTDFLIENGIPWNKRVSAKYEYDSELTWWRPGMKRAETWTYLDPDAQTVHVSVDRLKKWRKQRKTLTWIIKYLEGIPPKMAEAIIV